MEVAAQSAGAVTKSAPWRRAALSPAERKRLTVLTVIVLTYAMLAQGLAIAVAGDTAPRLYSLSDHTVLAVGASLALLAVVRVCGALLHTPWYRVPAQLLQDVKTRVLRRDCFLSLFIPLALLPLFVPAFLTFKSLIPDVHPFGFDAALHKLDQALHFGVDPWRLTHELFGSDAATFAINVLYNLWFMMIWGAAFYAITRLDRPVERFQYLCAMLVCWIINGTVLAYAFSAAGPCYFGPLIDAGADPYQPLMETLRTIDARLTAASDWQGVWALRLQQALLDYHGTSGAVALGGISAMPSMHVSLAMVMAMGMWRFNRAVGAIMWAYAAAILIGSIHLGWHYAADGYLSIITTFLIWKALGWAIRRFGLDQA